MTEMAILLMRQFTEIQTCFFFTACKLRRVITLNVNVPFYDSS